MDLIIHTNFVYSDLRFLIKMRSDCIHGLTLLSLTLTEKNLGSLSLILNNLHEELRHNDLINQCYVAILSGNTSSIQRVSDELKKTIEKVAQILIKIKELIAIVSNNVDLNTLKQETIEQINTSTHDNITRKLSDVVTAIHIENVGMFYETLIEIESSICTSSFIKTGSDARLEMICLNITNEKLKKLEIEVYKM